jgi:hypothetical protein
MNATMRIGAPQRGQASGSISKILFNRDVEQLLFDEDATSAAPARSPP